MDIARFAFRKRDTRFVLTKAAIAYVLLSAIVGGVALAVCWPAVSAMAAWYFETIGAVAGGAEPGLPPTETILAIAPVGAVAGIIGWILLAAFEAACLRWMVRGEQGGGVFGLNAGADTWRIFGLYWVWLGLGLLSVCGVVLFYVALRFFGSLHPIAQTVGIIIGVLAPLAFAALAIFFAVRLSPAAANTIGRKSFSFFGVWPLTRGKFWNLLGGFVIAVVGYLVVQTIVGGVLGIPINNAVQSTMFEIMHGTPGATAFARLRETFLSPMNIGLLAIYLIAVRAVALVFVVAWFGINASAVRSDEAPAG